MEYFEEIEERVVLVGGDPVTQKEKRQGDQKQNSQKL